jgi:hypothetical protein
VKQLNLPKPEKSSKQFLLKLVPALLRACGVEPEQSFYGFKFNIEAEARKRIWAMSEETAKTAIETLKETLKEW